MTRSAAESGGAWYLAWQDEESGPHTQAELEAYIAAGHVLATDHVWRQGWPAWRPIGEVFPLRQAARAARAPAMPLAHRAHRGRLALVLATLAGLGLAALGAAAWHLAPTGRETPGLGAADPSSDQAAAAGQPAATARSAPADPPSGQPGSADEFVPRTRPAGRSAVCQVGERPVHFDYRVRDYDAGKPSPKVFCTLLRLVWDSLPPNERTAALASELFPEIDGLSSAAPLYDWLQPRLSAASIAAAAHACGLEDESAALLARLLDQARPRTTTAAGSAWSREKSRFVGSALQISWSLAAGAVTITDSSGTPAEGAPKKPACSAKKLAAVRTRVAELRSGLGITTAPEPPGEPAAILGMGRQVCRQGDVGDYLDRAMAGAPLPEVCRQALTAPARETALACFAAIGAPDPEADPAGAQAELDKVLRRALWLEEARKWTLTLEPDFELDCKTLADELNTKPEHRNPHPDGKSFRVVDGAIVLQ